MTVLLYGSKIEKSLTKEWWSDNQNIDMFIFISPESQEIQSFQIYFGRNIGSLAITWNLGEVIKVWRINEDEYQKASKTSILLTHMSDFPKDRLLGMLSQYSAGLPVEKQQQIKDKLLASG